MSTREPGPSVHDSVHDMPLADLRERTREVHNLLSAARDQVRGAFGAATHEVVAAGVAKLHAIHAQVAALLPGLSWLDPEERRRMDDQVAASERSFRALEAEELVPPPEPLVPREPLSEAEKERAKRLLGELREGMERMSLLQGIADGIDELMLLIERGEIRLGLEERVAKRLPS